MDDKHPGEGQEPTPPIEESLLILSG
jgi:hypothetical protein